MHSVSTATVFPSQNLPNQSPAALPSAPSPPGSPAVGKRFCRNGCVGCNRLSRHGSFRRIADCGSAPPPLIVLVNIEPVQIRQHRTIVPASLIFLPHFIRVFHKTLKSVLLGRRIAASGHCRKKTKSIHFLLPPRRSAVKRLS